MMYIFSNKDFFSPAMVYLESFFLAVLVAMVYYEEWETEYTIEFFLYVVTTASVFILAAILVKSGKGKGILLHKIRPMLNKKDVMRIHLGWKIYSFFFLFSIITLYVYFKEVYRIAGLLGNSNGIEGMFFVFHNKYVLSQGDSNIRINVFVLIMTRINAMVAYYFEFIFCNNVIRFGEKILNNAKYLFPPVIYMIQVFIGSQRTAIIYIVFAFIYMAYTMERQNRKWRASDKSVIKIAIYCFTAVIAMAYVLRWTGELMGRVSEIDVISYFSAYLAGGIPNFAHFIKTNDLNILSSIANASEAGIFRAYSGVRCNLYTWLSGVGTMGVIGFEFYAFIISVIYSNFYYAYIYKKQVSIFTDYALIIFSYAMQGILFVSLTDIVMSHVFTVGYVFFCLGVLLLHIYLNRVQIVRIK